MTQFALDRHQSAAVSRRAENHPAIALIEYREHDGNELYVLVHVPTRITLTVHHCDTRQLQMSALDCIANAAERTSIARALYALADDGAAMRTLIVDETLAEQIRHERHAARVAARAAARAKYLTNRGRPVIGR